MNFPNVVRFIPCIPAPPLHNQNTAAVRQVTAEPAPAPRHPPSGHATHAGGHRAAAIRLFKLFNSNKARGRATEPHETDIPSQAAAAPTLSLGDQILAPSRDGSIRAVISETVIARPSATGQQFLAETGRQSQTDFTDGLHAHYGTDKVRTPSRHSSIRTALSEAGIVQPSATDLLSLAQTGRRIRADFENGHHAKYGKIVTLGGVNAVEFHATPEGIQNFRALLAAAKIDSGLNGVAVLVRPSPGYIGSRLFALVKDNGRTVGGVTREGTVISICKSGRLDASHGKDNRFIEIMDVVSAAHDETGGGPLHFACLSSIAELYNKKYGAEMIGVVNQYAKDHTPGWSDEHTRQFEDGWKKFVYRTEIDGEPATINLPLVGMRINRELHARIKTEGPLKEATQDFTDFSKVPSFPDAHAVYAAAQAMNDEETAAARMHSRVHGKTVDTAPSTEATRPTGPRKLRKRRPPQMPRTGLLSLQRNSITAAPAL